MKGAFEFHISKTCRDRYGFDETLYALSGNVILSDFVAVRLFAQQINEVRRAETHPERSVTAGALNAMGLIDEIFHYVLGLYRRERNQQALTLAWGWLVENVGGELLGNTICRFVELFPPMRVHRGQQSVEAYLEGETEELPNTFIAMEEMLLLSLANENPAFRSFEELFDDTELADTSEYRTTMTQLTGFFETQPGFGSQSEPVVELLKAPAAAAPHSLFGQLVYMRENWQSLLPPELMLRVLRALDVITEEEKLRLLGPGPALVPYFGPTVGLYEETERFSSELDWMPQVVLIAKNAHVWLEQLSRKYGRTIDRLDQIPDEELDLLARWGFKGLWLIGLWERSAASQKIKQLMGNPEALASAYAVYDYVIAADLGGEAAYQNLQGRAWQRGIRLAGDMVPNHMGIDSKWVMEHPEWFIQLDHPPFPSYRYSGPNLSWDERVGIYIEDGYWHRSDAAVVFKRVDHWTGDVRYVYHGNDGTSMPWNDTAQLDFLKADVREAAIQTILHVAKKFPIIRFDAAMTLTKRHFQRLWYPQPGSGGDIPSRAEYGLSREEFDRLFPVEFWREVVDRVAHEVPDTLLLAEAFWLMEGYFVRTLGMHRVYNSAFMNMLKMEDNANYRSVMKNVLEFNPEILRRLVNFMNNPDEATAVEQFGKDDKYFGVALMMVTMPGLPLFGHGQIEGHTEKYGMEYRKSYWNEEIDTHLVQRHETEIFPLMRKRHLFSGVENFVLYDFFKADGSVDENVFAYSNRSGDERALILYHNKYATTSGWIRTSTAISMADGVSGSRKLVQKRLAEGLDLKSEDPYCYVFREQKSGLEYIRRGNKLAEQGLYAELGAYQYQVFLDFREIHDQVGYYAQLERSLNGRGVPSIDEALRELLLAPIHTPFREVMNPLVLERIVRVSHSGLELPESDDTLRFLEAKMEQILIETKHMVGGAGDPKTIAREIGRLMRAVVRLNFLNRLPEWDALGIDTMDNAHFWSMVTTEEGLKSSFWRIILAWLLVCELGKISSDPGYEQQSTAWVDELLLGKIIAGTFQEVECSETVAWRETKLVKILVFHRRWLSTALTNERIGSDVQDLLSDTQVQQYLEFNWYDDTLWFNKERFEELMNWLLAVSIVDFLARTLPRIDQKLANAIRERCEMIQTVAQTAATCGYRVEAMLEMLAELDKSGAK